MKHAKLIAAGAVCLALLTGGTILAFGQSKHEHTLKWIVDAEPTISAEGQQHPECTECGYTGQAVSIPKIHVHTPEAPFVSDAEGHWQECVCGEKMHMAEHTMEWVIDREATAEADGLHHPACVTCGYEGAQESFHVHFAGKEWISDGTDHWNQCRCGEKMNVTEHTLKWAVDRKATAEADGLRHTACETCGYKGEQESYHVHFAGKEWASDGTNHWHLCRCGEKMNVTKHTLQWVIDREATAEADGLRHTFCKTCNYASKQESYHVHFAGKEWTSNGTSHWHLCRCGAKMNVTKHTLQWVIDREATAEADGLRHTFCKTCNYASKQESYHVHFAGKAWTSNGTNHWNLCRCGTKMNVAKHTSQYVIDREATAEADGLHHPVCTICSHAGKQVSYHVHFAGDAWHSDDAAHWNQCRCGEKMNIAKHKMTLVIEIAATATTEGVGQQTCTACSHVLTSVKIPTTRYSQIDVQNAIDAAVKQYGSVGLQIATIKNGKLSFVQSYGWAQKNVRPMTDDIKMRIASPTKVIVGMCAMSMMDAGLLDLDAPLSVYWGEGVQNPYHPETQPTMRHLLTHVSSLNVWDAGGKKGLENLRNMLKKNAWTTAVPGDTSIYAYNNFAFNVVGTTLEIASNRTLESYFQSKFLSPMGIRASLLSGKLEEHEIASLCWVSGYVAKSAKEFANATVPEAIGDAATNFCGGLTISAKDYAKLMAILANNGTYNGTRYLSASAVAAMETPQFTADNGSGAYEQCLVLRKKYNALGRSSIYYHTGSAYGLYSQMTYDPNTGDGVVVMTAGGTTSAKVEDMNALCADITRDVFAAMNKG